MAWAGLRLAVLVSVWSGFGLVWQMGNGTCGGTSFDTDSDTTCNLFTIKYVLVDLLKE